MPTQTPQAIEWALTQEVYLEFADVTYPVTKDTHQDLVDKVREYFNNNNIAYEQFSYDDLKPYL